MKSLFIKNGQYPKRFGILEPSIVLLNAGQSPGAIKSALIVWNSFLLKTIGDKRDFVAISVNMKAVETNNLRTMLYISGLIITEGLQKYANIVGQATLKEGDTTGRMSAVNTNEMSMTGFVFVKSAIGHLIKNLKRIAGYS